MKRLDTRLRIRPLAEVPLVSIVVVNYNGRSLIKRCLKSILRSSYREFELIVVDNASTDGSARIITEVGETDNRIKLVSSSTNLGFARGCNLGASKANGRYLVFLNMDTDVDQDVLTKLVALLEENPLFGAAQSKLLLMNDKRRLDSAGDTVNMIGWPYSIGRFEIDQGQYDSQKEIFSARGAGMIVRKKVFDLVGGFDSDYFMYYEDLDLSWRIRLHGYKIGFAPHSTVYHRGECILESRGRRGTSNNLLAGRNYIETLVKNLELPNLFSYGVAHVGVHILTVLSYVRQGRAYEALGLFMALPSAILTFPRMWRKRLVVQLSRSVSDEQVLSASQRVSIAAYLRHHTLGRERMQAALMR